MWTLFTTALARGTSTTQVSIMNTSTNFMFTAFLGYAIFGEHLPPMWWAGAALLVAGNVIVGRKDEGAEEAAYMPILEEEDGLARRKDDEDEDVVDLGEVVEGRDR
jgi:drug/metabolite transporter (DMT)-like permease